jgi:hypothetical protein
MQDLWEGSHKPFLSTGGHTPATKHDKISARDSNDAKHMKVQI